MSVLIASPSFTSRSAARPSRALLRLSLLFLIVWLVSLLAAPGVSAHARVIRSDPASGGSFIDAPKSITLWFSEAVETRYSTVNILRSDGSRVVTGDLEAFTDGAEPGLRLSIKEDLGRGSYTIVWSVLSTVDGHVSQGFQSFTVGDALMPSAEQQARLAARAGGETTVPKPVDAGIRWVNLLAQTVITGMLIFLAFVLIPAAGGELRSRRFRQAMIGVFTLLLIGQVGSALLQTMNATRSIGFGAFGDPLVTLLTDTRFGTLWLARVGLIVVLALLVRVLLRGERVLLPRGNDRVWWLASFVVAGLMLLTGSLGSHAAVRGGRAAWPVVVDWLHFAGASIWAGGLVALVLSPGLMPSLDLRRAVLARFSVLAGGAVVVLVATGVLSARLEVVSWDGLISTRYGTWFLFKLVLVAMTLGFGAYHLLTVRPALDSPDAGQAARADRWFRRSVRVEAACAVAVLLVTGALTSSIPVRDLLDRNTEIFAATRLTSGASITLRVSPGRVGANQFSAVVAPSDATTFGEVQRVYLKFTLNAAEDGAPVGESQRVQLQQSGPDDPETFLGSGSYIALDGEWDVSIVVRRAGMLDLEVPFSLTAQGSSIHLSGVTSEPDRSAGPLGALLGVLWIVVGASLAFGGWRMRRYRQSLSYGLLALSAVALVMASVMLLAMGGLSGG